MKLTATREEVRQAFLVDDLQAHTERVFKDLYGEIDAAQLKQITENAIGLADEVGKGEPYEPTKRAARIIKGSYILGYLEADQHHNVVARHAYNDLFGIEGGEA
jgi:hypothetical protein